MGKRSRLRTQSVRRRRLIILILLLSMALAGYAWYEKEQTQLIWEQVRKVVRLGKDQFSTDQEITRGTIYDRNYKELAISYERVSVYANIREIEDVNQVIAPLSSILETSENDLYDRVGEGRLRVWLAKDISQDQEDEIRKLDLPGVYLHREYIRYYPQGESAAHLVGFAERDSGLSGIEQYLNKLEARHRLKKDDTSDLLQMGDTRPGVDGRHLILTLDLKIQRILDEFLKQFAASMHGIKVGALVMEADSGALIAYDQVPSFDPNKFHTYQEAIFSDLFNEKIAVPEPFKIFLKDLSLFESQAGLEKPPLPWSVVSDKRKLGVQLQLWNKLGADAQPNYDFISSAGIEPTSIPYNGGLTKKRDFETVPEMQTPLQLLTAVTRAVNGGAEVTPHAGERFVLRKNQQEFLLEDLKSEPKKGLLLDGVSEQARELFKLLGVTGPLDSSVLQGESTTYRQDRPESLTHHFLGIALLPQKKPELVLLLTASGPGFQAGNKQDLSLTGKAMNMFGSIVALQRVMKNLSDMMSPKEQEDTNFRFSTDGRQLTEHVLEQAVLETEMVSFTGMSLRKCLRLLHSIDVKIEIKGSGRVVSQEPPPGTKLKPGTQVVLILEQDAVDAAYKKPQISEPE